ncbi:hypothetical protein PYW08_013688 [Mythimna loreyi]|uniref:Uncharacterized protein n=1 Tax=Mythimna loreyi TaxID=667449 RepID=A0ACC2R6P2_9NEOP|nr:hypothetical protein PYW08_013688 [Mythimna loreyi]
MKVDVVWRRRGAAQLAACWVVLAVCAAAAPGVRAAGPLGPSDRPEAYFNGSSYIRLSRPISLKQLVGLSFRTCVGGELFSQRYDGYTLHVTSLFEQVVVSWQRPSQPHREVGLAKETLDNRWHWVGLRYNSDPPSLLLEVDKDTQIISNVTWNPELLSPGKLEDPNAVLLVGNVFSGCILEGPQLEFHAASSQTRSVVFGHCPLTTDDCIDRKDVLRIQPKDHCYNEPCMRHGTCISRHDRYECHCTARYTGNNCEVDAGDPCASGPCQNGARCVEDIRGDYSCDCPPNYHGTYCELEVSLDPQCVAGPCRNNGSCSVPPGADSYVCACPPGYTGRNCETDIDDCAAQAAACLNGGSCLDAVNNYTCDCTGTGYTGARCELNVNECEEERGICGHGVCYDTYGGYVCACQLGYKGERCNNVSACASGPCGAGGACVEESGGAGFRCVCARGFAPPYCEPAPTTHPASCQDIVCPPKSHCISNMMITGVIAKQVMCVCDAGYYGAPGVAPNCTTLEAACDAGACLNGATCDLAADHFNCTCAPGYKGAYCEQAAGKALSDLKAAERCASGPCLHAKTCQDLPTGFRCECEAGWAGPRCDVAAGAAAAGCGARGCANGGACLPSGECECRAGWAGAACELAADCRAAPCAPQHDCAELGGAFSCVPVAPDSACASEPCHNGTCQLKNGLYSCLCPPGITGQYIYILNLLPILPQTHFRYVIRIPEHTTRKTITRIVTPNIDVTT